MEIKMKDVMICGGALFAIFFGAGNLIFPPHLGVLAGKDWWEVMVGFLITDPILPVMGVIVTAMLGGKAHDLGKRVSPTFAKTIGTFIILIIGPLFAIPRTGAVTHEVFIKALFPMVPSWVTGIFFFGITLYITLNPSKVVEVIGKYLTPILVAVLLLIIGIAIFNPPGPLQNTGAKELFTMGFKEGYQTMDAIGAPLMAGIVVADIVRRGYSEKKIQFKVSVQVGIFSAILLAIVYGGLTYAGATVGFKYGPSTERTALLIGMVHLMLGNTGKVIMGVAVATACLTTSTGLTSIFGGYFDNITNGKLPYKLLVIGCTILSYVISLLGVDQIVKIAVPVLIIIYPSVIVLILMSLFDRHIKYNWTYTGAVVGSFFISGVEGINMASNMINKSNLLDGMMKVIGQLPFANVGFEWVMPAVVGSIVFTLISMTCKVGKTINDPLD